ncbi:MAG: YcxB family protein [Lachnospiraceae bacterium]|nr:YcxB family protein [Lachnospiraceae bacterium]
MEQEKFYIVTKMEQEDHKKFMYITTFVKRKSGLIITAVMSLLAGLAVSWILDRVTPGMIALIAVAYFFMIVGIQCYKINKMNKQRAKTDRAVGFGAENHLHFYDDHILMEMPVTKSSGQLRYDQIYEIMETKEFFAVYTSSHQASLIRKKDIKQEELAAFIAFLKEKMQKGYKTLSV